MELLTCSPGVKEAIIKLKKHPKIICKNDRINLRYIFKNKESTNERPGRPWKSTKVDDRRILSLVKNNPL